MKKLDMTGHGAEFRRYQRGMTPISPSRPVYGHEIVCECGYRLRVNDTKREAVSYHRDHVRSVRWREVQP